MMSTGWTSWPEDLRKAAQALLDLALDEDLGSGDVTARYFGGEDDVLRVKLTARQDGRLAGLPLFLRCFQAVEARYGALARGEGSDSGFKLLESKADGSAFAAGDSLARLSGPAAAIHAAERTALNFLQRLSAVATATARAAAASCGPIILDTRKTTPGYRLLEKYAVRMGGGQNHRLGLFDAVMVKDNHKEALGGIGSVMARMESLPQGLPVIVEVDELNELAAIIDHPLCGRVQRVLLDNFNPDEVAAALALRDERGVDIEFEISGGLAIGDLSDRRLAGVDYASLGFLTHSAAALDLALETDL